MFIQQNTLLKDLYSRQGPHHSIRDMEWHGSPGNISRNMKGTGISEMGPPCTDMKCSMSLCKNYVWRKLRCLLILWNQIYVLDMGVQISIWKAQGWVLLMAWSPGALGCNRREEESTVHISLAAHNSCGEFSHDRNNKRREPHTDLAEKGVRDVPFILHFFRHTVL